MLKVILAFLCVNLHLYAIDSETTALRAQLYRMASLAHIPLEDLDDIHFSKPLEETAPYWVMNLLYSSGKLDRILLADAIYKSGLQLDNYLLKEMNFRWDTSLSLNYSEIAILKARDLAGGYIVGLYGTYQNIQDAAHSPSNSVRRAYENMQAYLNRGLQYQYITKREIVQKAWEAAYQCALQSLSFNDNEWNVAFFLEPYEVLPQPYVASPIPSNASAPDVTPTREYPPSPPQDITEEDPLGSLGIFQSPSRQRRLTPSRRTLFAPQQPQPAPNPPMSISEAFAENPIHQHDSLAWFSNLGVFFA